jgi:hypothetical protein
MGLSVPTDLLYSQPLYPLPEVSSCQAIITIILG